MGTQEQMTKNQSFLHMVNNRLNGLRINNPDDAEVARLEVARGDILSRMEPGEYDQYVKLTTVELTPQQRRAQAEAERQAMENNRDKPSI